MKILPFERTRDEALYIEGDTDAFMNSYPGVTVTQEIAASIRQSIEGISNLPHAAAFTLVEDEPIGFVMVSLTWFYVFSQGYVNSIYVKPNKRGLGASQRLLHAAERWSIENGARTITLDVSLVNNPALVAYRSAGYTETRVQMEKYLG